MHGAVPGAVTLHVITVLELRVVQCDSWIGEGDDNIPLLSVVGVQHAIIL